MCIRDRWEEIRLVAPRLLVTLGNTPLRAVRGFNAVIGDHHGKAERISLGTGEYWLFALYHPASIIYNPSLKETYSQDLSNLAVWLGKNI